MEKNNLLIILPWLPYPLNTGGNQAVFNSIKSLQNDINIYITYQAGSVDHTKKTREEIGLKLPNVKIIPFFENTKLNNLYKFIQHIEKRVNGLLLKTNKYYRLDQSLLMTHSECTDSYINHIHKMIRDLRIDIVQTEFIATLSLVFALPSHVKKVFVHHELRYIRNEQTIKGYKKQSLYCLYKQKFLMCEELAQLNCYDAIITLSQMDARKLKDEGVITPVYASFAMNAIQQSRVKYEHFSKVISFVGPANHEPNRVGLIWFMENCWKDIITNNPDFELNIIGVWPSFYRKEFKAYQNVNFLGFVDNLAEALKGSIVIVPITIGSGIRMKILEAAYLGIPFITTTIGVEGLPFEDGRDCYIADTPQLFVERLNNMADVNIRKKITQNAYNKVKTFYSLDELKHSRMLVYNKLLKKR